MDGRRRDLFKLGGVLGAVGLIRPAQAQGRRSPAGSWMVQIVYDNTTNNQGSQATRKTAMCQFFHDGRWMGSVSAVNQDSSESWPANWRQATYHGEWDSNGDTVRIQAPPRGQDETGLFVTNGNTSIPASLGKKAPLIIVPH